MPVTQDLVERYVDRQKLYTLWTTHPDFKDEGCKIVEVKDDSLIVELPREMTPYCAHLIVRRKSVRVSPERKLLASLRCPILMCYVFIDLAGLQFRPLHEGKADSAHMPAMADDGSLPDEGDSLPALEWERYPETLPHVEGLEMNEYHAVLRDPEGRLFDPSDTDIVFRSVPCGGQLGQPFSTRVHGESALDSTLKKHGQVTAHHYIWAPFNCSGTAVRKIFSALGVRPSFLDVLSTFGPPEEGFEAEYSSGYDMQAEDLADPLCKAQVRKAVGLRLLPVSFCLGFPVSDTSAIRQSRQARLEVDASNPRVALSSVQSLQYRCELLHSCVLSLRSNVEVLAGLELLRPADSHCSCKPRRLHEGNGTDLKSCVSQFKLNQHWAEDMLDRAKQASDTVATLLNSTHSQNLVYNTATMNLLAKTSQDDSSTMLELARAAKKDSSIMKLIGIGTMIYLPGSFISAIFSTGFVAVLTGGTGYDRRKVVVQAVIFTVATLLLTAATLLGGYFGLKKFSRKEARSAAQSLASSGKPPLP
ncbi:hypothetical protein MKZ38_000952 [Zalerion maritima]|uniref:CorA-like transporter domain-containing protein n=1 Tax=Zalerion maritima TaxID=339359 RepID=A0AAD5RQW2_9PEZI|nr:hypothetical protein MKZ38_000952 [Zalerion maritima]